MYDQWRTATFIRILRIKRDLGEFFYEGEAERGYRKADRIQTLAFLVSLKKPHPRKPVPGNRWQWYPAWTGWDRCRVAARWSRTPGSCTQICECSSARSTIFTPFSGSPLALIRLRNDTKSTILHIYLFFSCVKRSTGKICFVQIKGSKIHLQVDEFGFSEVVKAWF